MRKVQEKRTRIRIRRSRVRNGEWWLHREGELGLGFEGLGGW